jgi:hypothetical protein
VSFDRGGDFTGAVTISTPFTGPRPVVRAGGKLYTQGDGSTPEPFVNGIILPNSMMREFNLTAPQAQRLGTNWFSLDEPAQQVTAGAITSGIRGVDTPGVLASTLYPAGVAATWYQRGGGQLGLQLSNGEIVMLDQSTMLPVLVSRHDGLVLDFRSWNAPLAIGTPSPLMPMP